MGKRGFVILALGLVLFLQGCETLRGMKDGVKKDAKNTWENLSNLDSWMKENMW